jgi:hypothetical protein
MENFERFWNSGEQQFQFYRDGIGHRFFEESLYSSLVLLIIPGIEKHVRVENRDGKNGEEWQWKSCTFSSFHQTYAVSTRCGCTTCITLLNRLLVHIHTYLCSYRIICLYNRYFYPAVASLGIWWIRATKLFWQVFVSRVGMIMIWLSLFRVLWLTSYL